MSWMKKSRPVIPDFSLPVTRGTPRPREPRGQKLGTVHTTRSRYMPVLEPRGEVEPIYDPLEIEAAIASLRKEKELQSFLGVNL